ncbi:non-ribosomal peptide synthetase [Xanthomonas albilineans]|uniref:non-ribosomal peptide synthetase n=1 Tax=Xanthomonas albilineans TaxID=29447 RepID=UPI0027D96668|nr:non-ribosomal peptide synthetase [Xanthomonas albilineans]
MHEASVEAGEEAQLRLLDRCMRALPAVLRGERKATELLFPEGSMAWVEGIYQNNPLADYFNAQLVTRLIAYLRRRLESTPAARLKLCEIGAGSGGTTASVLQQLQAYGEHIEEYLYTDLSPVFLHHAEKHYQPRAPYLRTAYFDVERAPTAQALESGGYDVVIAANVLHATRDIAKTLRNAKALLKPGGLLLLNEVIERSLVLHLTFGLLESWWLPQDRILRLAGSPLLACATWRSLLEAEGFAGVSVHRAQSDAGQVIICAYSDGIVRQASTIEVARHEKVTVPSQPAEAGESPLDLVKKLLGRILKMDPVTLDTSHPLEYYGVDSIVAIELAMALRETFPGFEVSELFETQSIDTLLGSLEQAPLLATLTAPPQQDMLQQLKQLLARTLKLDITQIDTSKTLESYGVDSIVIIELANALRERYPSLDASQLMETLSIDRLVAQWQATEPAVPAEPTAEPPVADEDAAAIIGLAGRFPGADTLEEFWNNLRNGQSSMGEVPGERWDHQHYFDSERQAPGKTYSRWGAFLRDIDGFDAAFFEWPDSVALESDPQARIFLEQAYAGIEDAGYTPGSLSKSQRVGVFVGVMNGYYSGGARFWQIANRVSYQFDFRGPSLAVDTACSASLTAIHLALESLRSGSCEVALAGGVNLLVDPQQYLNLAGAAMLSAGASCRPFGEAADGFVAGEACGVVLLKPLKQARADGDVIHAVIKGSMINAGGQTSAFSSPNPAAQAEVVRQALQRAGVAPDSISYIEAHGTGTVLGDAVELGALNKVFDKHAAPCLIGSLKANIGHAESAAGIAGLAKLVLQFRHGELAPSLNAFPLNPYIEFGRFQVQQQPAPWPRRGAQPRRAGLSAFGAGGSNAHLVVEEAPAMAPGVSISASSPALIVLSARTLPALQQRARDLLAWMQARQVDDVMLADVAYTLHLGRVAMEQRLAFTAGSAAELSEKLQAYLGHAIRADIYLSEDTPGKPAGAPIVAEEDLLTLMDAWIEKGQYGRLLEYWTKGQPIDWNELYWRKLYADGRPRRISLPTYPFEHRRYWQTPVPGERGLHATAPATRETVAVGAMPDPAGATVQARLCALCQVLLGKPVTAQMDFFAVGGHSVLAIQLVSRIRKSFGVEYPVSALFESALLSDMARQIEQLRVNGVAKRMPALLPAGRAGAIPATYAQERLWLVHEHMSEQRSSYNITFAMHFRGVDFRTEAMRAALNALVARHEVLRTRFLSQDGQLQQVIAASLTLEVPVREVSAEEVDLLLAASTRETFDLRQGPLFKARILRVAADHHVVLSSIHHIISDGWSLGVFNRDLHQLYEACLRGTTPTLPTLAVQYADYALWQRQWELAAPLSYWTRALEGYDDGLDLPYDRPRGATRAWRAGLVKHRYPPQLAQQLAAYSQQYQATLFMSLLAGLALVLGRYADRKDVCIGATVSGRDQLELEELIGFFINILPLRVDLSGDPCLEEVLLRTRQVVLDGFAHQSVPFEHVLQALRRQRDSSQIPLVPVMLRHQNFPTQEIGDWPEGVRLTQMELGLDRSTPSELDWQFYGDGSSLELTLEYAQDLFDEATVRRMIAHHQQALEAMVSRPQLPVGEWDMLTAEERRLFAALNATGTPREWPSLAQQFERQAQATPQAIACVSDGQSWSYAQLEARANQLAQALRGQGAGRDVRVAVQSARTPELLMALLAIFKAGACYVPIDPAYPAAYREQILAEVQVSILLEQGELALDEQGQFRNPRWREQATTPLGLRGHPGDLACVMVTSGSTGRPKGVMVPYAQLHNWLHAGWQRSPFEAGERVLQKTSIAFAVSVKELLSGLLAGVEQVMLPDEQVKDSLALARAIEQWQVTRLYLVPSHLQALLDATQGRDGLLHSLRHVVTAGEALPSAVRETVRARLPQVQLWNNYGCTELNDATYQRSDTVAPGTFVPIGAPIANTEVYVLDRRLRQVPIGVMGELHVHSVGMARGYWNRPGLTASRFIAHPYSEEPGTRLYKTGDMVRRLADGTLEYLGRQDFEVKVRGHRVDTRQVEAALRAQPAVAEAVVSGHRVDGDMQLVAYVVAREGQAPSASELKQQMSAQLPTYMLPTVYQWLEQLPRLSNGKLDRLALPAPQVVHAQEYVAPRNEAEQRLAALFAEVLRVEQVGIHDNFFALGGHSLSASQLISRIARDMAIDLSLSMLFELPTVAQLSESLASHARDSDCDVIPTSTEEATIPLSTAQERMWFLHKFVQETPYNTPGLALLQGELDISALQLAFRCVLERHAVLRTHFVETEQQCVQVIGAAEQFVLQLRPIRDEADLHGLLHTAVSEPFDLERELPLRALLYRLDDRRHYLAVVIHHIVFDGWSTSILFRELATHYAACRHGQSAPLPPLELSYADYARWERARLNQEDALRKLEYWKTQLADAPPLVLPTTYARPVFQNFNGATVALQIEPPLLQRLQRFADAHSFTLYMLLLAALGVVLSRHARQKHFCIGSPVANRARAELHGLIGLFVNTLAVRLDLDGNPSVRELLERIHCTTLAAYEHQDVPFERIVESLKVPRDTARNPLVQVMLNFQNMPMSAFDLDGVQVQVLPMHNGTAKCELTFDLLLDGSRLSGFVEYATGLFAPEWVQALVQQFKCVLAALVERPEASLNDLPMAPNEAQPASPALMKHIAPSVPNLLEAMAANDAARLALQAPEGALSYAQLIEAANEFAWRLRCEHAGPDKVVALCLAPCSALVVALLAASLCGAASVLIDPTTTAEAQYDQLFETRAGIVVTCSSLLEKLPLDDQAVVLIDEQAAEATPRLMHFTDDPALPAMLHCMCDEKGRTRTIMVESGSLSSRLLDSVQRFSLERTDRFLLRSPLSAELAHTEVLQWLAAGGSLSIAPMHGDFDAAAWLETLATYAISVAYLAQVELTEMLAHLQNHPLERNKLAGLRVLVVHGAPLPIAPLMRLDAWLREVGGSARIFAAYGNAEFGAEILSQDVSAALQAGIGAQYKHRRGLFPLGANSMCHVVQSNGRIAPDGMVGELWITQPACLYKTDALVRRLPNGQLEWLGSLDVQSRIDDPRIDLCVVEAQLRLCEDVGEAVVLYEPVKRCLVAYLSARSTAAIMTDKTLARIRQALSETLPDYLLPAIWVPLAHWPRLSHGRVDLGALPAPDFDLARHESYIAPRTAVEQAVAEIWQRVLKRTQVGVHDNFFELGGHSVLAIQLVSGLRKALAIEVPVTLVFEAPILGRWRGRSSPCWSANGVRARPA